jgi:DNA-binding XRE family transcriptional regulator
MLDCSVINDLVASKPYLPVQALKTYRIQAWLTQAELAREVGLPETVVRDLECSDMMAPLPLIRRLAGALEVRPEDIVFGEPTSVPGNPD